MTLWPCGHKMRRKRATTPEGRNMGRDVTVKVRMTAEEQQSLTDRAKERNESVSGLIRSLLFPTQALPVTTADKIKRPKSKLCAGCAKVGKARWNCPECNPRAVLGPAVGGEA